jgi:RHS repeat-associated protein
VVSDHLGSPRALVNAATGAVVQTMEFDPFGNVLSESGDTTLLPHGFAGGLWDRETGLVRFGARNYDPVTGRWTTKDPILFQGGQANLYAYVNNDPVNRIDPTGLWDFFFFGAFTYDFGRFGLAVAGESVGIIGYNSDTGLYVANIAAGGGHIGGHGTYVGAFHCVETAVEIPSFNLHEPEEVTLCEAAVGVNVPGAAGAGLGVGGYFGHAQDGGFSYADMGALGQHAALGFGGSIRSRAAGSISNAAAELSPLGGRTAMTIWGRIAVLTLVGIPMFSLFALLPGYRGAALGGVMMFLGASALFTGTLQTGGRGGRMTQVHRGKVAYLGGAVLLLLGGVIIVMLWPR